MSASYCLRSYAASYSKSTFPWKLLICCSPRPDEFKNPKTEPLSSIFAWVSHFSWNRGSRTKKSKFFFCLKMAGNGQKQRALTFFDVFWVICCFLVFWKFLIFHDDLHSRVMNEVIYLRNQFWSSLLLAELYNNQFQSRNKTFFSMNSQL